MMTLMNLARVCRIDFVWDSMGSIGCCAGTSIGEIWL